MKLLELIVKNVKREDIPPGVSFLAQNWKYKENKVLCFINKPYAGLSTWVGGWYLDKCSLKVEGKADDAKETIITREELIKAYDLVERGYTLWFGGDCPVDDNVVVEVLFYDGELISDETISPIGFPWYETIGNRRIVAYRALGHYSIENKCDGYEIQNNNNHMDIINIITQVMPGILAVDAIEIANSLIDEGYHK